MEQIESDRSESGALEARIQAIEDDLRKHKDIGRLRKLGSSEEDLGIGTGICPTCHQEIPETFLDTGRKAIPMSVEQNIQFLGEQLQLFNAVLLNGRQSIEANEVQAHAHRAEIENLRQRIRSLRETAISTDATPSIDAIAERFRLEQRVSSLEYVLNSFEDALAEFAQLADEWKAAEERRARLPKGSLSETDENAGCGGLLAAASGLGVFAVALVLLPRFTLLAAGMRGTAGGRACIDLVLRE